jgi:hypothetical protein
MRVKKEKAISQIKSKRTKLNKTKGKEQINVLLALIRALKKLV